MANFKKFFLTSAAVVGAAATAYFVFKKKNENFDEDEDFDCLDEECEDEDTHYVSLNPEEAAEDVADVVEDAADVVEDAVDAATETVEEFFNDEN